MSVADDNFWIRYDPSQRCQQYMFPATNSTVVVQTAIK